MRHSKNIRPLGFATDVLRFRDHRGFQALLSTLLTCCLSPLLGQSVMAQTPAAPVHSVLKDTAIQSSDIQASLTPKPDRSYMALASSLGSSTNASPVGAVHLGATEEGPIFNITEGEDRVIGQVPAGKLTSSNMNQYQSASPEYSQVPSSYMGGGGSYSGYASSNGSSTNNPCCPANCHSYYAEYEALWFLRQADQTFSLSQRRFLPDFDYEYGNRITLGQMLDCTDGVEIVYTGPLKWSRIRVDQSNSGALDSVLTTNSGYIDSQIDTFNGARRHIQAEQSRLQSYEGNRRWFAEDVMSTLIGFRAIQFEESYLFDSVDQDFGAGFYRKNIRNYMLGGQIGADVYRPIGQRLSIGSRSRIGIFADFNRGETILANRGNVLLNARHKDIDPSYLIQYGTSARYRILPHVVAVGGYEAWILGRVATVSDQSYTPINPNSGLTYRAKDTVFFHGATGGIEITW